MTIQDKDQPVLVRPTPHEWEGDIVKDYVLYKCPVRKCIALALEDWRGRYWTATTWMSGGDYLYMHRSGCGAGKFPIDQENLAPWDEHVSEIMYRVNGEDMGICLPHGGSDFGNMLGYVGEATIPPDDIYDSWRAKAIEDFDTEWGAGAFMISVRSARARHANQIRKKRYRNRVLTGGESCAT